MAWLKVVVHDGRIIGGKVPPVIAETWVRVRRDVPVRKWAIPVLNDLGFLVDVGGGHLMWERFPLEAIAWMAMRKGGGRAGSPVYSLAVRRAM